MMSQLKKSGILLLKASLIVMAGLALGFGVMEGVKSVRTEKVYSVIEAGKPYEPVGKTTNSLDKPLKPSVGPAVEATPAPTMDVLVLSPENTLVFNDVVTDESVSQLQLKLMEMSNKLPDDKEIILVLNTPGGSVTAGLTLIDNMKAVPQKVKTLTIFAASMGFQIVQNMDERMIIPSGVLMSHRAAGGMEGEIGGDFDVRYNAVKRQIEYMDTIASRRMKMSLEDYHKLIADEYWVHGFESVDDRAADKLVLARCGKEMIGTEDKKFEFFGIPISVTFSKCPLITGPLEIKIGRGPAPGEDEATFMANSAKAKDFAKGILAPTEEFYREYFKTKKYLKIMTPVKN